MRKSLEGTKLQGVLRFYSTVLRLGRTAVSSTVKPQPLVQTLDQMSRDLCLWGMETNDIGLINFLPLLPQRRVIRMRLSSKNCVEWRTLRIRLSLPPGTTSLWTHRVWSGVLTDHALTLPVSFAGQVIAAAFLSVKCNCIVPLPVLHPAFPMPPKSSASSSLTTVVLCTCKLINMWIQPDESTQCCLFMSQGLTTSCLITSYEKSPVQFLVREPNRAHLKYKLLPLP